MARFIVRPMERVFWRVIDTETGESAGCWLTWREASLMKATLDYMKKVNNE